MKSIIYNFFWLFSDRIIKLALSLIIGVWIVRYFGPEYYGKFNYVNAWLTLMAALVPLGTESILISELVKDSESKESLLASSFFLYLSTSIIFTFIGISFILTTKRGDLEIYSLTLILCIPYFFRCLTVPRLYFESKLLIKKIVIIENILLVFFSLVRVFFLIKSFNFIYFIWSFTLEGILISVVIYLYYITKYSNLSFVTISWSRTKNIILASFPLFLSSMAIVLYMKVDQIMIGNMIGDRDLGIYSVAVRLSELWYFVPMAVSSSFYPHLIQLYQENRNKYWFELQRLHVFLFGISFAVAICVQIFSDIGIEYLYGEDFKESSNVLKIHVWSGVFVFLGVAGSNHFIISNIQKYSFYKSAIGLLTNIILNFLLIPRMGIYGAAIATLISQFVASSLFLIYNKETYILFQFQFKSLFFWNWFFYFLPSKKNFS